MKFFKLECIKCAAEAPLQQLLSECNALSGQPRCCWDGNATRCMSLHSPCKLHRSLCTVCNISALLRVQVGNSCGCAAQVTLAGSIACPHVASGPPLQEIGLTHMRISDGVGSRLQLSGLLARLCKLSSKVRKN